MPEAVHESDVLTGTMKFFSTDKGYGFVVPDNGSKDVFVHINQLKKSGIGHLMEGDRIQFSVGEHKGRYQAVEIGLI
jgi:CspA family cold shock protein